METAFDRLLKTCYYTRESIPSKRMTEWIKKTNPTIILYDQEHDTKTPAPEIKKLIKNAIYVAGWNHMLPRDVGTVLTGTELCGVYLNSDDRGLEVLTLVRLPNADTVIADMHVICQEPEAGTAVKYEIPELPVVDMEQRLRAQPGRIEPAIAAVLQLAGHISAWADEDTQWISVAGKAMKTKQKRTGVKIIKYPRAGYLRKAPKGAADDYR